jgi:hypothetical protein
MPAAMVVARGANTTQRRETLKEPLVFQSKDHDHVDDFDGNYKDESFTIKQLYYL